jgi:curli production assembly/transport component CsgG
MTGLSASARPAASRARAAVSRRVGAALAGALALLAAGCTESLDAVMVGDYSASLSTITPQNRSLRAVPLPSRRVPVAVYDFEDLTGQYKDDDDGQTLSRAVTQGGTSILIKALLDAGERRWFAVLDRSELDDVLRERQIVTEMRRIYRAEDDVNPDALAPLAHSNIIIQGAVVGYDTNLMTGGVGARYLGVGGDRRWQLDIATVNLRAVSAQTGEALASVVVRKPIASVADRGSIFTYIALDELLEAEAGRTVNEPRQVAIEQAIEKAVIALIAEGAISGLWHFQNDSAGRAFVEAYLGDKFDGPVPSAARTRAAALPSSTAPVPRTVPRPPPRVEERPVQPTSAPQEAPRRSPPPATSDSEEVLGMVSMDCHGRVSAGMIELSACAY